MKKEERKTLEKKIHGAILEILKNEKSLPKDKIEKTIKKLVKQLLKKLSKKGIDPAKEKAKKKAKKTVKSAPKGNTLTASYKKIDITDNTKTPASAKKAVRTDA